MRIWKSGGAAFITLVLVLATVWFTSGFHSKDRSSLGVTGEITLGDPTAEIMTADSGCTTVGDATDCVSPSVPYIRIADAFSTFNYSSPGSNVLTVGPTYESKRRDRFHWYALSPDQRSKLEAALAAVAGPDRKPVLLLCGGTFDCLDLAQDIGVALQEAGWEVDLQSPLDAVDGLRCTQEAFCALLTAATGITSHRDAEVRERIVLHFGRKGK